MKVKDKYYKRVSSAVTEKANILLDMPIQTDKEIKANRPDVVVKDKKERTCLFIDMSVPVKQNSSL